MARFLTMYCGNFKAAQAYFNGKALRVIGQTTETSEEMVAMGENVGKDMLSCGEEFLDFFTNNDHYLNGIRLACKKGRIDSEFATIFYFRDEDTVVPTQINFTAKGGLDKWPVGFCCAIENALCQL